MKNDYSIVITTCDKFSDLWSNNLTLLNTFWPSHNEVFLVSDKENDFGKTLCPNFYYFHFDYSFRLLKMLETIQTKYVFLTLDDYLIANTVNENRILEIIKFMDSNNLSYVRFFNRTKTKGWLDKKRKIHLLPLKKDAYEVNLYPSLWNRKDLISIITKDENIWKFEVRLTRRSREKKFKCGWINNKKVFDFVDTIRKGKYLRPAYKFIKRNNLYLSNREQRKFKEDFLLALRTLLSRYLPDKIKRKLKKRSKKAFFSECSETDD